MDDPVYVYVNKVSGGYLLQKVLCMCRKYTVKQGFITDRDIALFRKKRRLNELKAIDEEVAQMVFDSNDADIKFSKLVKDFEEARRVIEEEIADKKEGYFPW